jgi:hypothetical protein
VATSIQELTYELSLGALNQQESALKSFAAGRASCWRRRRSRSHCSAGGRSTTPLALRLTSLA